jgi:predicted nucleic acid-binding protein
MSQIYAGINISESSKLSVNPITKVKSVPKRNILDTNVIISIIEDPLYAYNFKKNFPNDAKFVTTEKMWEEAERKTGLKSKVIKWTIKNHLGDIQTIRATTKLQSFAYSIQCKTSSKCHWPDSILVVLGIWFQWTIVTHDHDLLKTCQYFKLDSMRPASSGLNSCKGGK